MMNLIDKVSSTLSQSVDFIVDKNRQCAQLNRLEAIISNETDILNNAYIALGKIYMKKLEGSTEEADTESLIATIKNCKLRLKKAKTRYEYTKKYGVPQPGLTEDAPVQQEATPTEDDKTNVTSYEAEEEGDITIAYAEPQDAPKDTVPEKTEEPAVSNEKKTDTAADIKRKRSSKKKAVIHESDSEAANETDSNPPVSY